MSPFGGDDFFDRIFPPPLVREVPVQSLGSGFIVHSDGYVVTNAHVVRRAEKITVTLADGTQAPAKVISSDPDHDLAVIKMAPPEDRELPYLRLGRSDDLMVGETVIAIGNPLGYTSSLTTGVISAVGRTMTFAGDVEIKELIQTDAPINPGNSGGPLLNVKGELIGINTAIRADAQNIGFAIPVDALTREFSKLLDFESINRMIFGADVEQRRGENGPELVVREVRPGTPAAEVLRVGDRLLSLNGRPLRQVTDFACEMIALSGGDTVRLGLRRGVQRMAAEITLTAKPRPNGSRLAQRLFGLRLRALDEELARSAHVRVDRGLLVVGLEEGSPAQRLGIEVRDVLFQVGKFYVTDLETLGVVLETIEPGERVQIGIVRGNVRTWVHITARKGGVL
jgi:serine protease Do